MPYQGLYNAGAVLSDSIHRQQSIPGRFEEIVRQNPDHLAVKMADWKLSYAQLNRLANRIAREIVKTRSARKEPVALLFEHGIPVIAALLGVLKTGKFYVVLEHSSPVNRLERILKESEAALLLTNERHLSLADQIKTSACDILNVDRLDHREGAENLNLLIGPDDYANVIYTTGSTGEPKGVVATHLNILDSHMVNPDAITIRADDRLTLLHSLSFHAAHGHLFQSLLNGASLFPFDVKSAGVHRLTEWLRQERITMCHLPNSVFRQLAETISDPGLLSGLRLIHLSGAPMSRQDFELYKQKFPEETRFEVSMGSTETTGICSAVIDRSFSFPSEGSPIGYPRRNKQVLLLDENGQEVPAGEIGEIAVKTRNMKPGYWRRPDLTKAKFRRASDGEGIYLTGDLGRRLPDGFFIHLGRKDALVKIRGYRVDLGEIERTLLTHPMIEDAGVAAWERPDGEKTLAAYIVRRSGLRPKVDELRSFLGERLPNYMTPSYFALIDSLPSINGKLDRKALPRPDGKRPDLKEVYLEPATAIERELVQIWQEVLGIQPIGIRDNFFDLGGHSLAATRIITRVLKKFQSDIPLKTLFDAPTVAEMASAIAERNWEKLDEKELRQALSELESLSDEDTDKAGGIRSPKASG